MVNVIILKSTSTKLETINEMALLEAKPFSVLICYILGFWIILLKKLPITTCNLQEHLYLKTPNSDAPKMRTFGQNHTNGFMSLKRNDMSSSVSNCHIYGQFVGLWNSKFFCQFEITLVPKFWFHIRLTKSYSPILA